MRGAMIVCSDIFDNYLKERVDGQCKELSKLVATQSGLIRSGSFQLQGQGSHLPNEWQNHSGSEQQQGDCGPIAAVILCVPPGPGSSGDSRPICAQRRGIRGQENRAAESHLTQPSHLRRACCCHDSVPYATYTGVPSRAFPCA